MIEWFLIGFLLGFVIRGDWRKILNLINEWRKKQNA